jgi:hypothetical protein
MTATRKGSVTVKPHFAIAGAGLAWAVIGVAAGDAATFAA